VTCFAPDLHLIYTVRAQVRDGHAEVPLQIFGGFYAVIYQARADGQILVKGW
jgi:hypothetical protein